MPASALDAHRRRRGLSRPGLIDPHTHLLFAGTRHAEVEMRQRGHALPRDPRRGGGILQTVRMTRAASDDELLDHGRRWLARDAQPRRDDGRGQVGLRAGHADRAAAVGARRPAGAEGPVEVVPTFLGAHAVAPEFRDRPDAAEAYLAPVIEEQLPAVAEQGIATFCDVFCERGVFDVGQARRLLSAARDAGLRTCGCTPTRSQPSVARELAAELGALSADHLGAVTEEGIARCCAADDGAAGRRNAPADRQLLPGRGARRAGRGSSKPACPSRSALTSTPARRRRPTRSWRSPSRFTACSSQPAEALAADDHQRGGCARHCRQRTAHSSWASTPTWRSGSRTRTRCCPTGWARTSCGRSIKRGRVVFKARSDLGASAAWLQHDDGRFRRQ